MTQGTQFAIVFNNGKRVRTWYQAHISGIGFRETTLLCKATMFLNKSQASQERGRLIREGEHPDWVKIVPIHFSYEV